MLIGRQGRSVAAVELVSPQNDDRPTAREAYLARDLGSLLESMNFLLEDVHRLPLGFSFADRIAASGSMDCKPLAVP
jgi:hypothetical protein